MAKKSKTKSKVTVKSIQKGIKTLQKGINDYKSSLNSDKEKTIAQVYKTVKTPEYDSGIDGALDQGIKYYGKQAEDFDEGDIRSRQLSLFQKEIDATNAIYADQLASAAIEGRGRLGSTRAKSAREGVLGSDFGEANKEATVGFNRTIETGIQNEKQGKIASILGKANESASAEIQAKRAAQKEGLDQYLQFLGTKNERKDQYKNDLAKTFLEQGIAPDEVDPKELNKIAKNYGLKTNDIITTYQSQKKAADDAKAEADAKARKENSFNLSEGQSRYEYDPITGEYNQVAFQPKTYAPGTGGGSVLGADTGYVPGADPTVDSWANAIKNGTAKITDIPAKNATLRNQVQVALDSMGNNDSKKTELNANVKVIDDLLLNPKLGRITGKFDQFNAGKVSGILSGGKTRLAKNKYDQIKGLLSLESRQKLKGSGAISDFEFKVLEQASTALARNLNDADFASELQKVRDTFQAALDRANAIEVSQNGGAPVNESQSAGRVNTLTDAQGNSFDASSLSDAEYEEALADGFVPG